MASAERSERPPADPIGLAAELRHNKDLVDRISAIQGAVVAQSPLHDVFDQIVQAAAELIEDPVAVLRVSDGANPARTTIAASAGPRRGLQQRSRPGRDSLTARAISEGRVVVADRRRPPDATLAPSEWDAEGLRAAMVAPIFENGVAVGSLGVASRDPQREYSERDEQALVALARHATLAINQAKALDEAAHDASHDALTGLPNRGLFWDRLALALTRARPDGGLVGILFVDLDDFKTVNDSLGHRAGDELLVRVAARFARALRPTDMIARIGGDEFAVLLEDIRDRAAPGQAAEALLAALTEPISVEGREVVTGASIGIAAGSSDAETLMRNADLAMYRAKARGRSRYETFEQDMHSEMVERLDLRFDVDRALEHHEIELFYQPILELQTGAITGVEALARWRHPTRGLLGPARFIQVAEASGRIHDLSRWVLGEACHQAALWRARYPTLAGLQVGVNLSATQLREPQLITDVARALESAHLDADGLTLEITETTLIEDFEIAARRLAELKELGVDLAVDDFGMGHSSLRYLQQLQLDNLKIAQPFVDEIGRPDPKPPILRAILDLADVFGLRTVAEGIERKEQNEVLLELGCEMGQGHLLGKPLPASVTDDLLLRSGLLGSSELPRDAGEPSRSSSAERQARES